MDSNLRREIILDNYQNPFHKQIKDDYLKVNTNNESCIDNIDMQLKQENGVIKDIVFDGEACAISTASTSIMIKNMIGSSIDEAMSMIENFDNMLNEREYDDTNLNEAIVFDETYKQGNRKTCVTLPYTGIKKVLESYKK